MDYNEHMLTKYKDKKKLERKVHLVTMEIVCQVCIWMFDQNTWLSGTPHLYQDDNDENDREENDDGEEIDDDGDENV